ncbi:MAG TPA: MFS transporter [Casimicrobiaceae bacterium]|nr:MFS transporter [Casimicrobiaceae bacterium]
MTPARIAAAALAATLTIQIYVSFATSAAAVLAPEIAREFGIETRWVGVFVGIVYGGAMFASLASGTFVERHGAIRVSQACVLLCALGVCLVAASPATAPLLLALAAIIIGLGYGPITPASSHLLQRTAPPARLALTFSIKQTGVPAGVALAGALLPAATLAIGWRPAFAIVAAAGLIVLAIAQPIRHRLDADRNPRRRSSLASIFAPLAILRERPALLELALVSLAYSAMQVVLTSFLVTYLTETLHWALVPAGFALTAATVGGVTGRIGWGHVADRFIAPRRVLTLIGCLSALFAVVLTFATPDWATSIVIPLVFSFGATAIGWNGVQLSEVARLAEPGMAGKVTGATGFVTFAGVVAGPPSFALLSSLTGSYRVGFVTFAACSTIAALSLLRRRAGRR